MSSRSPQPAQFSLRHLAILGILILIGISTASQYLTEQGAGLAIDSPVAHDVEPATSSPLPTEPETELPAVAPAETTESGRVIVANQTIRDQSGRVLFRGDIDLTPTLERIARGERHEHRNDGGTFRNLEGRLPRQPGGYYKEYVHPTAGVNGPGPQRVVLGKSGEIYYTPDHYESFQKLLR
ncbi:hypothetical protein GC163_10670 [bacterium]|nr:hypothetical protein [bacterium]